MLPGWTSVQPAGTVPLPPVIAPLVIAKAGDTGDELTETAGEESRSTLLFESTLIVTVSESLRVPPVPVLPRSLVRRVSVAVPAAAPDGQSSPPRAAVTC